MVSCFDFPCVPSSNHFVGAGCLPLPMFKAETMRVKCSFQVVTVHRGTVLRIFCFWFIKLFKRFQCSASLSSRGLLALFWSSPSFSAHLPCMETERSPWLVWCWLWMGLWQRGRWSSGWRRQAPQARQATTPNPPRVNLHKACQMFRCVSMFRGFLQIISWKQV